MQLSQAEITQQNQQQYSISGTLDFSTVPGLMQSVKNYFKPHRTSAASPAAAEKVTIDLSQITECNSAGLALLLEIVKHASLYNIKLHFENLPVTLMTIARAYGIESEIRDICK